MRPKQWIKNGFVFTALIFSKNIFIPEMTLRVTAAFFAFCLISGVVYIVNDVFDLERDRIHPTKKERPIASGRLSVLAALYSATVLFISTLVVAFYSSPPLCVMLLLYFLLNVAYSKKLKEIVLIDVFSIAAGFVIRVFSGAIVINVFISSWLVICTILLALFLAFSKRRHEILVLERLAVDHRKILSEYSTPFLDQMISVVTASTVVSYALYTMSEETVAKFNTQKLIFTVPFVLYGIFRYLYLVHQKDGGGNPTIHLLTDIPLILNILLWILVASIIIYFP
jgi:4-hydroxybenzoate polyprenyltransferase